MKVWLLAPQLELLPEAAKKGSWAVASISTFLILACQLAIEGIGRFPRGDSFRS